MEGVGIVLTLSLLSSVQNWWSYPTGFLGFRCQRSGMSLVEGRNISIFLFLVVVLLCMLLVVVRVSGAGSAVVVNEKA